MTEWQVGTLVSSHMVADDVKSLVFRVEKWVEPKAGQHYDIRLTAPNGYQAERSYSVACPPEEKGIVEFGIQQLPGGEVSTFLYEMEPGKQMELRGPLGGHFVWDVTVPGPLVLIGGGSGMVPLMSMLRHHEYHRNEEAEKERKVVFLISAPNLGHVLWRDELEGLTMGDKNLEVVMTLTRQQPEGWTGYRRRIDEAMLTDVLGKLKDKMPMIYVCGPTPFVEAVADGLVRLGFNSHEIKTERFGGVAEKPAS